MAKVQLEQDIDPNFEHNVQLSIALSLKRIADRLDMAFGENTLEQNRRDWADMLSNIAQSVQYSR